MTTPNIPLCSMSSTSVTYVPSYHSFSLKYGPLFVTHSSDVSAPPLPLSKNVHHMSTRSKSASTLVALSSVADISFQLLNS